MGFRTSLVSREPAEGSLLLNFAALSCRSIIMYIVGLSKDNVQTQVVKHSAPPGGPRVPIPAMPQVIERNESVPPDLLITPTKLLVTPDIPQARLALLMVSVMLGTRRLLSTPCAGCSLEHLCLALYQAISDKHKSLLATNNLLITPRGPNAMLGLVGVLWNDLHAQIAKHAATKYSSR